MKFRRIFIWASVGGLCAMAWGKSKPKAAETLSHVRIVRLSLVSGPVQVRFPNEGWRRGLFNAPVTQGERVRTGANARAEVELEDGSSIRLIPSAEVKFSELALLNKVRLTTVQIERGTIFLNLLHKHTTRGFRLLLPGGEVTTPFGKGHFRVDLASGGAADVQVLNGHVNLLAGGLPYKLNKNEQLSVVPGEPTALAKNKNRDAWDQWNHKRNQALAVNSLRGRLNSPFNFGLAEMSSYGDWNGGCWQPIGMSAGWSPYSNGTWFYDPAMGFVWDSFYPWGWMPYHFGAWMMGASGWCWSPENDFWSFAPMPTAFYTPGGAVLAPPPQPPVPPKPPVPRYRRSLAMRGNLQAKTQVALSRRVAMSRQTVRIPNRTQIAHMTPAQRAAWNRARTTTHYWIRQAQYRNWQQRQWNGQQRGGYYRAVNGRPAMRRGGMLPVQRDAGPMYHGGGMAPMPAPAPMSAPTPAPVRGGGGRVPH